VGCGRGANPCVCGGGGGEKQCTFRTVHVPVLPLELNTAFDAQGSPDKRLGLACYDVGPLAVEKNDGSVVHVEQADHGIGRLGRNNCVDESLQKQASIRGRQSNSDERA
jgi:hypothetical protein